MLVIILPTLGLSAFFASQLVRAEDETHAIATAAQVQSLKQAVINDLVHELQKERGFSAGFIASGGANFTAELPKQRTDTDRIIDPALIELPTLASRSPDSFATASEAFAQLETVRATVSKLAMTVPEMAGFYTKLINDLLVMAAPKPSDAATAQLDALQTTRVYLAVAKENAGLERAMGATGLGSSFTEPVRNRLLNLQGAQVALLRQAKNTSPDKDWQVALYENETYQNIKQARAVISAGLETSSFGSLTPAAWFQISTAWIELLREQERLIAADLGRLTTDLESQSNQRVKSTLWVGVASILLTAILAIGSFEHMISRIKKLTVVVDGFAKGDFSNYVPSIDGKDEISRMGRAIYVFKQETLAMRRDAEALKASDEELLNAKHGKVVELVTEGLSALAKADLTCHFDEPLDPDYDKIREDFNASTTRLRSVLHSIAGAISELDMSSADMKRSAEDLTQRTSEQVEIIRTTTHRVDALSVKVESFGQEISTASSLATNARKQASASANLMQDAVGAMDQINSSSEKIGQIISMIDDISFQTNLLSLNAGVEAARAGEAGRGFAVVASEVRQLALRAGAATTEIRALVDESGRSVGSGVDLVKRTGDALTDISEEIARVDDVLDRILSGSEHQISELKELNSAIHTINKLADGNTAMAKVTSTSSRLIADRSQELSAAISDFELGTGPGVPAGNTSVEQDAAA